MKKLRAFLKYTVISLTVALLILVIVAATFLFQNKAPIVNGEIEYGINYKDELKLDLYRPTNEVFEKSPVVFFIHGGAWIRGTKTAINFNRFNGAVNTLRENGYTIVCPDYSQAGEGKSVFPECILDVYEAIEWTKRNAALYNLDTANLGILGESAGAHIGMMIAFPETTLQPEKYKKTKFNYLIDIYGPNDLTDIYHGYAVKTLDASIRKVSKVFGNEFDIKEYVLGFDPSKDTLRASELFKKYSPINVVQENKTPVLVIHGKKDRIVPLQQSVTLKSHLDSLKIPNEMHVLSGVDHNFLFATGEQKDSTQVWVSYFVLRNYWRGE